jgi:hypothetical protein
VNVANGNIATGSNAIVTANANIATSSNAIVTANANIATSSNAITIANGNIALGSNYLAGVSNNLVVVSNGVNTANANIASSSNAIATANANIATSSNAITIANGNISLGSNYLAGVSNNLVIVSNGVNTANANIATSSNAIVTANANIATGSNGLVTANANIASASNAVVNAAQTNESRPLNDSNAQNTFTGKFTGNYQLGQLNFTGFTNVLVGNGQQPDLNIGNNSYALISGNTAAINIPGMNGGGSNRFIILDFAAGFPVTFNNESLGDGVATNRFDVSGTGGNGITSGASAHTFAFCMYNPQSLRWQMMFLSGIGGATNGIAQLNGFGTNTTLVNPTISGTVTSSGNSFSGGIRLGTIFTVNDNGANFQFDATTNQNGDQAIPLYGSPWTSGPGFRAPIKMTNAIGGPDVNGYYTWDNFGLQIVTPGFQALPALLPGEGQAIANYGIPIVIAHALGVGNFPNLYCVADATNGHLVDIPFYDGVSGHIQPEPLRYDNTTNVFFAPKTARNVIQFNQDTGDVNVFLANPTVDSTGSHGLRLLNGAILGTTNGVVIDTNGAMLRIPSYSTLSSGGNNGYWDNSVPGTCGWQATGGGFFGFNSGSVGIVYIGNNGMYPQFGVNADSGKNGQPWQNVWANDYSNAVVINTQNALIGNSTFTNLPSFPNQASNTFFAGPKNNGASAAPTFRLIDKTDLPAAQLLQAGETNLSAASSVIVQYKINMADTNYNVHLQGDAATLSAPLVTAQTVSNFTASMTSFTGGLSWTIIERTQ